MELEPCYTSKEVAERYRVTDQTVRRWIRTGWMHAVDLGPGERAGPYAIRRQDLEAFESARALTAKANLT